MTGGLLGLVIAQCDGKLYMRDQCLPVEHNCAFEISLLLFQFEYPPLNNRGPKRCICLTMQVFLSTVQRTVAIHSGQLIQQKMNLIHYSSLGLGVTF